MKNTIRFGHLFAAFAVVSLLATSCKQTSKEESKPDLAQFRAEIQAITH
ncbi:MAG: hypothetical protein HXX13_11090 [Bacteroidetes bacterium]|nr:hypothetical protein [Bacteroidota bacterium]